MLKVAVLTLFQCLLLASGQVCFKLAVEKIGKFCRTWDCFLSLLTNWWLLASGIFLIAATVLWGFILKHFPLSIAYPLTAVAYIFGMLAAVFIFKESVPFTRWIGVGFIMIGVFFLVK